MSCSEQAGIGSLFLMSGLRKQWDYLIVTASNDLQAQAYRAQLDLRVELGLLPYVRKVLVVPDPEGKRVGSGGSTIFCLMKVLEGELDHGSHRDDPVTWQRVLERLRILIIHAGGDSQRLPAYGPCGKIFVPVPDCGDSCLPATLFDCQLPTYLALQAPPAGMGQVIITAGDVLLDFDPREPNFRFDGLTGLGCFGSPEQATNHGVFCREKNDRVKLFLQKPSVAQQRDAGAIESYDQAILDIGVMNFGATTAVKLLRTFGIQVSSNGRFEFSGDMGQAILDNSLDFYREICCSLGTQASLDQYIESVKQSGSTWPKALLRCIFQSLHGIPFHIQVLPRLDLLHFGTTQQIISSGIVQLQRKRGLTSIIKSLDINNKISETAELTGTNSWVEGCQLNASLTCGGQNVIVGLDVDKPLSLPAKMCLDMIKGLDRSNNEVWFVRIYGLSDTFKNPVGKDATFCNIPVYEWIKAVGASSQQIWDSELPPHKQTLWQARVFPAVREHRMFYDWLWMFEPSKATLQQHQLWLSADRYSLAEMALLADPHAFVQRRNSIRAAEIQGSLQKIFHRNSGFSSNDLEYILKHAENRSRLFADLLLEAYWYYDHTHSHGIDVLVFPRIMHTIAAAVKKLAGQSACLFEDIFPSLSEELRSDVNKWLTTLGLDFDKSSAVQGWGQKARSLAFRSFERTIIKGSMEKPSPPKSSLRADEIVWGRAPARLDIGGGWTDTPPHSLEFGGCVVNFAVDLNGQPPIQVYGRVVAEPVIRIGSIDLGVKVEIGELQQLLDYRQADSSFGLAKAAIALSGFAPTAAKWPKGITLREMLEHFGGGIELTTLAAIPKGSGLGTSSIMGAVMLAVVERIMGRSLTQQQLFQGVLCLEQAVTAGGGWQDQIGGVVGGLKIISTESGIIPDARIHYLPSDVLDPKINGGQTLLYYTGITRLAKNILEQVVGRILNRDRLAMATLRQIHSTALSVSEALSRKDIAEFGQLINEIWKLNKQLDCNCSNQQIEQLLEKIRPYVFGAKLLGAGGGGFLLMICRSSSDSRKVKKLLTEHPPNQLARFFDYSINPEGLVVTVC
jgi:galactokinase/mevalonate kinase-like predicted kinase